MSSAAGNDARQRTTQVEMNWEITLKVDEKYQKVGVAICSKGVAA